MPLIEPVATPALADLGAVHLVGIGGAGMSALAQLLLAAGVRVSGSDQVDSVALRELAAAGATVSVGHDATHVGAADTVVVSSAIRADNPELVAATRAGRRVIHRSTALAALMAGTTVVAVTGSHGKTTTTAMTVSALTAAGGDPSYVIGGTVAATGRSAGRGTDPVFVVEADESDGSFRQYPTGLAVVTAVEADHLDNWGTPEKYAASFAAFAGAPQVKASIVCADDPGSAALGEWLVSGGRSVMTYGTAPASHLVISDIGVSGAGATARFTVGAWHGEVGLRVPGLHNLRNAAAAWLVGDSLGCDRDRLLAGLATFTGAARRFQMVGEARGIRVVDDYAHHPTEIAATLTAARAIVGTGRVIVAFQPHLYSRTRDFADEFGAALAGADRVVVTDVYAAREDPIPGVTGQVIADAVARHGGQPTYVPELSDVPVALTRLAKPGDLVLTVGAGSITTVGAAFLEEVARS